MRHYLTIEKRETYDLEAIMEEHDCDYETAIEIAHEIFEEEVGTTSHVTTEED